MALSTTIPSFAKEMKVKIRDFYLVLSGFVWPNPNPRLRKNPRPNPPKVRKVRAIA